MFRYTVLPDAVPRSTGSATPSVVTLQITVTNASDKDVECSQISFIFDAGDRPENLVDVRNVGGIDASPDDGTSWSIPGTGSERVAYPAWPDTGLAADESISFIFDNVVVNQASGDAVIRIREHTDQVRTGSVTVHKSDPGLAITEFVADPVQVMPGQSSTLRWRTTGAQCWLSGPDFTEEVEVSGWRDVKPTETTTYTLTAQGGGKTVQQQRVITVPTVRIQDFTAEPSQIPQGDGVAFRWQVHGAESCTLKPGTIDLKPPHHGCVELPIQQTGVYTLIARGYGRTDQRTEEVRVMPVELGPLTVEPSVVEPGATATLGWDADWATGFRLDPPGQVLDRTLASVPVAPARTTTYTLTANGLDPKRREVTVTVGAAIVALDLVADPNDPGRAVLTWEVSCGEPSLAIWSSGTPRSEPVAASGSTNVPVTRGGLTNVRLVAVGGGETTAATLLLDGPLVRSGASLTALRLRSPSGVNSPGSIVTVGWESTGGMCKGEVGDASHTEKLTRATDEVTFQPGNRVGQRPLWTGDLFVAEGSNTPSGPGLFWEIA